MQPKVKTSRVSKYQIWPCKNGWLLNTYFKDGTSDSEVFSDEQGMTMLLRVAQGEGVLSEEEVFNSLGKSS